MNERQLRVLGHDIADKAENYLAMTELALPPGMLIDGMRQGFKEICEIARELYLELSDENPWPASA